MAVAAPATPAAQTQQPRFRATVDVIPVDVSVIDRNGLPVLDLTAQDFTVTLDGRPRQIASFAAPPSRAAGPTRTATGPTSTATGPTSNAIGPTSDATGPTSEGVLVPAAPSEPRAVILVFDQPNTRFGAIREHRDSINRFVDGLARTDPISVVNLGAGARSIGFTLDRSEVRRAVNAAIGGQPYPPLGGGRTTGEETVGILQRLIVELQDISGPKTILLVSERLTFDQRRPDFRELRRVAAAARATVHVLRLNPPRSSAARPDPADSTGPEPTPEDIIAPGTNDPLEGVEGILAVAGATGGFVFNVVNSADAAFDRVTATLAGYYLLGVESQLIDVDGQPKAIQVTVNRPGVVVSARRFFIAR